MRVIWHQTTKEVYWTIYNTHKDNLHVFGTCTDMDGQFGNPLILTEWGFPTEDTPLIKSEARESKRRSKDFDVITYYIATVKAESEEYIE